MKSKSGKPRVLFAPAGQATDGLVYLSLFIDDDIRRIATNAVIFMNIIFLCLTDVLMHFTTTSNLYDFQCLATFHLNKPAKPQIKLSVFPRAEN